MNRKSLLAGVIAFTGVIAIAIAAATLEDRWYPDEEGSGQPGPNGREPVEERPPAQGYSLEIPYLDEIVTVLVILIVIVAVIYLIKNHREAVPLLALLALFVGFLFLLYELIDPEFDPPEEEQPGGERPPGMEGNNGQALPPEGQLDWLPIAAVIAILGIVLIAAIAVNLRNNRPVIDSPEEAESSPQTSALTADIGEAAGRAADRIEASETYQNEVYRAWKEMTGLLDLPNPAVATPGDFAAEAIDAGLDPADVRDLTRLFEAVRYGDRPATEARERRAVELLRRIETRYSRDE